MVYKIEIRPFAALEIIEAFDWYETQQVGLGLKFLAEIELFYSTLLVNPYVYSYYEKPVRQGLLKKFPYQVVYEIFDEKIIIYAVFMTKQNPSKKRIF